MLSSGQLQDLDLGGGSLLGSLAGFSLLALGGVGLFVRRDLRATLERLGLGVPQARHLALIPFGVLALVLMNGGLEAAQRRWLPDTWAYDQGVVALIAGRLNRGETLLLGVSAGVGEELTMRGALQPPLGLLGTALLFAALHVQYSWFGMLGIVGFGLILGALRRHSNTTVAIAVHALYDILAALGAQHAGH
jgi:hypothetical protein